MRNPYRVAIGFFAIFMALSPTVSFAVDHIELDDAYLGAVSQHCSSTKIRLQRVQKDDARNRIHLGAQYESIATNLMLNLNLRLIKNNLADAELTELQTAFVSERNRFKDDYIGYSQEFESLLRIDCKAEPARFYYQLEIVRAKRADIDASMRRLRDLITKHRELVFKMKDVL